MVVSRLAATLLVALLTALLASPVAAEQPAPAAERAARPVSMAGDLGATLLRMVLVLAAVCLLAYGALRWGLKRFVAPQRAGGGAMEVLARLPLEPRRALLVVRVGRRMLVLASSEAGISRVGELDPREAAEIFACADTGAGEEEEQAGGTAFAAALRAQAIEPGARQDAAERDEERSR